MSSILELTDLKKYFKTPGGMLHAVDGITLSVEQGETVGVVGESGCGKSTLGRSILHLLEPTSGKIVFNGEDISSLSKRRFKELRTDMQMIFQDPFSSLNPRMTVSETISEAIQNHGLAKSRAEMRQKTRELMDTVGLAERTSNSYPHELDGGRRQRVGIARALSLNPKFVVCDEPVSALDVSIQAQILNLMQDLQAEKNLTYLFITHDLSVVKHISNRICVMYLGKMVELCDAKSIFKNPLHPYTQALLSAIPIPDIRNKNDRIVLKGEISSPIDPPDSCRFCVRCNYAEDICFTQTPPLVEQEPGHFVACHLCGTRKS